MTSSSCPAWRCCSSRCTRPVPTSQCSNFPPSTPQVVRLVADTTERGLAELRNHGLLNSVARIRKEPLSPSGYGRVNDYYLLAPFGNPDPVALLAGLTVNVEIQA